MQVILKENITGLGFADDVVTVKAGYGRNFLIPTGKAVIASKSALKCLAEEQKQRARKIEQLKKNAEALGQQLKNIGTLVITAKVTANGTIYGSVNSAHIVDALKAKGVELDRKVLVVKEAKEVGNYSAFAHLHKEVIVEIPFEVVAEGAKKEETTVETSEPTAEA